MRSSVTSPTEPCPLEVRRLGRTLIRWRDQIAAWHRSHVTNGPTEAVNNLVKRIKRVAFGFTRFRNYRLRALLYAGAPNWDLLTTPHPAEIRSARIGSPTKGATRMKVFLSWSGEASLAMAAQLKSWLPKVIQALQPWISSEDMGRVSAGPRRLRGN